MSERLQVPRGTYDVLPDDAAARAALEKLAQRILGGAGYGRVETPAFEYTDVFARGVGASTDIVQKEMYTFDDGGGRSVTLRPEGTAPDGSRPDASSMRSIPAAKPQPGVARPPSISTRPS